jgi:hypothetical protein
MTDAVSEGGGADRRAYSRRGAEVDEDLALFEEVELLIQLDELEGGASAVALLFGELIPLVDSAFAVLRGVVSGRAGGRSMRANTFFWIAMVVAYEAPTGRRAGYQSRRRLIRSAFPPKRFTVPAKAGWASVWRGASGVWRVARVAQLAWTPSSTWWLVLGSNGRRRGRQLARSPLLGQSSRRICLFFVLLA